MHHIDRVVFTFCCFILFVAVCTALYGFWTNPDNLLPAANSRNLHSGEWGKTQTYPHLLARRLLVGEKNVSSVFFWDKTKILAHEHWQLQEATDPLSERYTFKRKTGEINLD